MPVVEEKEPEPDPKDIRIEELEQEKLQLRETCMQRQHFSYRLFLFASAHNHAQVTQFDCIDNAATSLQTKDAQLQCSEPMTILPLKLM